MAVLTLDPLGGVDASPPFIIGPFDDEAVQRMHHTVARRAELGLGQKRFLHRVLALLSARTIAVGPDDRAFGIGDETGVVRRVVRIGDVQAADGMAHHATDTFGRRRIELCQTSGR